MAHCLRYIILCRVRVRAHPAHMHHVQTCCCTAGKHLVAQLPFNLVLSAAVLRPHVVHTAVQPRYQEVVDKMVGQLVRLLWEQERAGSGRHR